MIVLINLHVGVFEPVIKTKGAHQYFLISLCDVAVLVLGVLVLAFSVWGCFGGKDLLYFFAHLVFHISHCSNFARAAVLDPWRLDARVAHGTGLTHGLGHGGGGCLGLSTTRRCILPKK